jgi:hypothetical protein
MGLSFTTGDDLLHNVNVETISGHANEITTTAGQQMIEQG